MEKKLHCRKKLAETLIGEIYEATACDMSNYKPMNPRRVKRLSYIMEKTGWSCAETMTRLVSASFSSRQFRKEQRQK